MSAAGSLAASSLLEEATAAYRGTGQWDDRGFIDALELLLEAGEAMTPFGREVLRRVVVRRLLNRLHVAAYVGDHPDVPDRRLSVVAVVTGLPRTGTTVLQQLLAQDATLRPLRVWEALHPVPTEASGGLGREEAVAQARRWLDRMYELVPDFRAIHPASAEGPEECDVLLQNAFASQHFDDMFDAPAYSAWLYSASLAEEYRYYALQLRVLSDPVEPRSWVLKSPSHLAHLDALVETLPDALIVWCHRRPAGAIASWASLIRAVRSPYYASVAPGRIGAQAVQRASTAVDRALAVRAHLGGQRFLDLPYALVERDPMAAVELVYERAGRPWSTEAEAAMRRWLRENPRHGYGVHRYDPADFGLNQAEVDGRFVTYLDTFAELLA